MDFARHKRSGYAKPGKVDFQHPVRVAKKTFWLIFCLESTIIHGEVAFLMPHAFAFPLFKEKSVC